MRKLSCRDLIDSIQIRSKVALFIFKNDDSRKVNMH